MSDRQLENLDPLPPIAARELFIERSMQIAAIGSAILAAYATADKLGILSALAHTFSEVGHGIYHGFDSYQKVS